MAGRIVGRPSCNPSIRPSCNSARVFLDSVRGVSPSSVTALMRDRTLRLAAGLAVVVAIPVAILFYFQFRSISALSQSSTLVLRQLSQENADAVTKLLVDTLRTPRTDVL